MKNGGFWYTNMKRWFFVMYTGLCVCLVILLLIILRAVSLSAETELVLFALIVVFIAGSFFVFFFRVLDPARNLSRSFELFNNGYIYDEVFRNNFAMDEGMKRAMEKFEVMTDRNKTAYMAEKQVEYLTLQNQINPHFLYNTLESLRSEALVSGHESIAGMAEALAKFYRYTISNKEILVTLEDELENVKNYFFIQKYRFEERIDLEIICDDGDMLSKCHTLKLTLQPLVENAIQHGLNTSLGRSGLIEIDLERTGKFVFVSVRDYGVGIEESKADELNRMFQEPDAQIRAAASTKKTGIALLNVNARIKLLFGMEYGLQIMGSVGSGTEVRITLPYLDDISVAAFAKKFEMEREKEKG